MVSAKQEKNVFIKARLTWKAGDAKPRTQWFTRAVGVNLCDNDLIFHVRECIRKLFVCGCQVLSGVSSK